MLTRSCRVSLSSFLILRARVVWFVAVVRLGIVFVVEMATVVVAAPFFSVRRYSSSMISRQRSSKLIPASTAITLGFPDNALTLFSYASVRLLMNHEFISHVGLPYFGFIAISCQFIPNIAALKSLAVPQDACVVPWNCLCRLK
jgi:hypothetical protein